MPMTTRTTGSRRKAPAAKRPAAEHAQPSFIEPAEEPVEEPAEEIDEDDEVMEALLVDGLRIVDTHRPQNLPNHPFNYLKLTLEDGSTRHQCIDCPRVIGTRDEVRTHRRIVHPGPGRRSNSPLSSAVLGMTVAQLLEIGESSVTFGALLERVEAERDRYRIEASEATRKYTQLTRALDKAGFMPKLEDD